MSTIQFKYWNSKPLRIILILFISELEKIIVHSNNDAKGSTQILRAADYNRVYFFCPSI